MRKNIIAASALALAIVAIAVIGAPLAPQHAAADTNGLAVDVRVRIDSDAPEGGEECAPWGIVDPSLDVEPFRQLIITDHRGDIVGVMDLQYSTTVVEDERVYCAFSGDFDVPESTFYTFEVEGKYRLTVSRDDLSSADWSFDIRLL